MANTKEGTIQIAGAGTDSVSNKKLYDDWALKYEEDVRKWGYAMPEVVASKLKALRSGKEAKLKIIDAGAGDGLSGNALREEGFQDVVGIDISPELIKIANQNKIYKIAEVADLNSPVRYKTDEFDALTIVGVMTYLNHEGCCLDEFCRIVKPGGLVIMTHRTDKFDQWSQRQDQMVKEGVWEQVEMSEPLPYLPNNPEYGDKIKVIVCVYRVCSKDNLYMKVTNQKSVTFYIKCAKNFLQGGEDADGNNKDPVNQLTISGLGDAINAAVAAASACEEATLATITGIETSLVEVRSRGTMKSCAAIRIFLTKAT